MSKYRKYNSWDYDEEEEAYEYSERQRIENEYKDEYLQYYNDDDGYEGGRDDYNGYDGFDEEDF